jgi:hypothetical protein
LLTVLFGTATAVSLVLAAVGHRWLYSGDRDRLLLAMWLMGFWLFEEAVAASQGWAFVWSIAPAFDFAAGALMLVAWLHRPNWWRMAVWLTFWAMCVAHLAYRLDYSPTEFASERYRALINGLYGLLLVITSGSVAWDGFSLLRNRGLGLPGFRLGHRAGHEASR